MTNGSNTSSEVVHTGFHETDELYEGRESKFNKWVERRSPAQSEQRPTSAGEWKRDLVGETRHVISAYLELILSPDKLSLLLSFFISARFPLWNPWSTIILVFCQDSTRYYFFLGWTSILGLYSDRNRSTFTYLEWRISHEQMDSFFLHSRQQTLQQWQHNTMAIRTGLVLFLIAFLIYLEQGYCTLLLYKLILWKTGWLC